jgi:UDP-N-acetylmuramyl pentapeptide synthase
MPAFFTVAALAPVLGLSLDQLATQLGDAHAVPERLSA